MNNRLAAVLVMVLGATWMASSVVHAYVLGVVADRPESDGAFQGAEQGTLTVLEGVGVLAGLTLVVIGLVGLLRMRADRPR